MEVSSCPCHMLLSAPLAVSLVRASCAGYGEKDQLLLRSNRAGLVVPVHSSAPGLICGVARFGFGNAAARLVSSSSDATNQRSKWLTLLVLRTRDSSSNCNFFSNQIGVTSKRTFPSSAREAGGYLIPFQLLKSIRFKIMEAAGVPKRVYRDSGSDTSASQRAPPFLDAA